MTRRLAELTSPEVSERLRSTSMVIQPIGAVEQHGAHLPLISDTLVVGAVGDAAVGRCGDDTDAWLLEPIAYGKSNEHDWAPGTVSVSTTTLLGLLDDVARSVARTPARKLVFLNGHGGNNALLSAAARDIRVQLDMSAYVIHPFLAYSGMAQSDELDFHAGESETSVVAHLRNDLVRWDRAVADGPTSLHDNDHLRLDGTVDLGWRSDDFGAGTGVIGDPTAADPERGAKIFDAMVTYTVEALAECARHQSHD